MNLGPAWGNSSFPGWGQKKESKPTNLNRDDGPKKLIQSKKFEKVSSAASSCQSRIDVFCLKNTKTHSVGCYESWWTSCGGSVSFFGWGKNLPHQNYIFESRWWLLKVVRYENSGHLINFQKQSACYSSWPRL